MLGNGEVGWGEGDVIQESADLLSPPYTKHTPHFQLYHFTLRS